MLTVPFLQLCPVQPAGHEQRPLTGSQRPPLSQEHLSRQPWPNRPAGHATHTHTRYSSTLRSSQSSSKLHLRNTEVISDALTVLTQSAEESRWTHTRPVTLVTNTSVCTRRTRFPTINTPITFSTLLKHYIEKKSYWNFTNVITHYLDRHNHSKSVFKFFKV